MRDLRTRIGPVALALAVVAGAAGAQEQPQSIRERLARAGAPERWTAQVAEIVDGARAEHLPTGPLEAKAIEGWAKRNRVRPDQVVAVLEQMRLRMREARGIATRAGFGNPPGPMVSSGAEALGRGLTGDQVGELIRGAPSGEAAAAGLTVAASLAAQGLETGAAVHAVREMQRAGGPPERMFELPSAVADLVARGTPMPDVARRIMQGGGLPLPGGMGQGRQGRPDAVPPARGQGNRRRRH